MANLFKLRYVPNGDGSDSATALTNANTVFVHTYAGDDTTGDGTRQFPYRSAAKASLKAVSYLVFRGVINEAFTDNSQIIVGDDINQMLITANYSPTLNQNPNTATINLTTDKPWSGRYYTMYRLIQLGNNYTTNGFNPLALCYSFFNVISLGSYSVTLATAYIHNTVKSLILNQGISLDFLIANYITISSGTLSYGAMPS